MMRTVNPETESVAVALKTAPANLLPRSRLTAQSLGLRQQQALAPISVQLTLRRRGIDRSPVTIHYGLTRAWFGEYLLAWTAHGICWLSIAPGAQALEELERAWAPAILLHDPAGTAWQAAAIFGSAGSSGLQNTVPLHICGSAFQLSVWSALLQIRPGHFISYGDLASAINKPRAARAIGQAVGANGIAVLIPCHRVLAAEGGMGGYRWGTELKTRLLRHEVATAAS